MRLCLHPDRPAGNPAGWQYGTEIPQQHHRPEVPGLRRCFSALESPPAASHGPADEHGTFGPHRRERLRRSAWGPAHKRTERHPGTVPGSWAAVLWLLLLQRPWMRHPAADLYRWHLPDGWSGAAGLSGEMWFRETASCGAVHHQWSKRFVSF